MTVLLSLFVFISAQAKMPMVEELVKEAVLFTGPNCFNTAFRAIGVQSVRRHVTASEVDLLLKKHCVKVDKKVGAFGLLRENKKKSAFHGFLVLENDKVLTKNGFSKIAKNQIQTQVQMMSVHHLALLSECQKRGVSDCALDVEYWQCASTADASSFERVWDGMLSSRENMFSVKAQEELLDYVEKDVGALCSDSALSESFRLGFEYANYASITPEEFSNFNQTAEQFKALLQQYCQ